MADRQCPMQYVAYQIPYAHLEVGMSRLSALNGLVIGMAMLVLASGTASAQSSITGLVKDTTGAVMPGVTIEAASPALIERTRSVSSDAQGRYAIVDLRPGPYKLTFTLQGFRTVIQENIDLPSNFAATVNAELDPMPLRAGRSPS